MTNRVLCCQRASSSVLADVEREHEHVKREETPSECTFSHSLQVLQQNYDKNLLVLHSNSPVLVSDDVSDQLACLVVFLSHQLLLVVLSLQLLFLLIGLLVLMLVLLLLNLLIYITLYV